ncbi:MAG TPA: DUF378 domain-containing protein [Candidatus Gracilibacteria bacterium]|nr:DUF378 domain-containing protein [Candidatus Gracilibacteria bacterium]
MKVLNIVTGVLLAIGGLNWGLVGLGSFLNTNLNVVNLLLGGIPVLENIIYLVVGLSAILHAFTCLSHYKK